MKIVTRASEFDSGCVFVPTMGALHTGHASLFKLARTNSDFVVASIFVNPRQFESSEDLAKYPRTPDRDIDLAAESGVTHLWLPHFDEIYPDNFQKLYAGTLGDIYEGKSRTGHFDGVVTVVARLFELARPKSAIFGEKDFQQLTLIRKMAGEIKIIGAPTIRESDGLALSSRNVGLDDQSRVEALVLYRALLEAKAAPDISSARTALKSVGRSKSSFNLDYAEIIDEEDFSLATEETKCPRAIISGWLNGVRLLDNMQMNFVGTR
jgi:pantoate--beta-alanine ligase